MSIEPLKYLDYFYILQKPDLEDLCLALSVNSGDKVIHKLGVSRDEDLTVISTRPLVFDYYSEKESIRIFPNMFGIFEDIVNNNCDWRYVEVSVDIIRAPKKGHSVSLERIDYLRWEYSADYYYRDRGGYYVLENRDSEIEKEIDKLSNVYCFIYVDNEVARYVKMLDIVLLNECAKHLGIDIDLLGEGRLQHTTIKTRAAQKIIGKLLLKRPLGIKRLTREEADNLVQSLISPVFCLFKAYNGSQ